MSLWQILTFLGVAGGVAYTYVVQPMSLELGIPRAQCWWEGGVYLRATNRESGYQNIMRQTSDNSARLKTGEAAGCFNEGACAQNPTEAVSALEQKMLSWTAVGGGELLKGNVLGMLGMKAEDAARAKQAEAQYCLGYLAAQRNKILAAEAPPTAAQP
jgi:hypothetical protein